MKRAVLTGFVLLSLAATLACGAATRRVPSEYPTIQMAISDCNDGDVVIVDPGEYIEIVNFSGKDIVVRSIDPNDPDVVADTVIDAEGDGSVVIFENGETAAAVLTGFTITGGSGMLNPAMSDQGVRILWGAGIYCYQASPTITGNVITGNHGPCILGASIEDYIVGYGGAIGGWEASPIITRNIIKNNSAYAGAGVFVFGEPQIRDNLIYANSAYIGGGVILFGGHLINNTIVGNDASLNGGGQIGGNIYTEFSPEFGRMSIVNNIICSAKSGGGIFWQGDYPEDVMTFNDFWKNTPGNYASINAEGTELIYDGQLDQTGINGNISRDPLFVDAKTDDYHLQLDSPCANAGDPILLPLPDETDIDGQLRIFGGRVDIGADEYVGYLKPVANAGPDQHVDKPQLITLDGSGSFFYDPCGVMEFEWEQASGPAVVFSDFTAVRPTFMPECEGEYLFELVVGDGLNRSQPDDVLIVVRNRPPVADAGPDQSMSSIPALVTLDGSASYDPGGETLTYHWRQIAGPAAGLSDPNAIQPTFVPSELAIYVFELVVNDGVNDSRPDTVGIVIGNRPPVADAGSSRYTAQDPVVLDGTGSFDLDGYGELTYQWQQVSGPPVNVADENTATPTISGFVLTNTILRCELELTVSDGALVSQPDTVEVIIVPYFGNRYLRPANPPFDPDKPTIVAFGGGDCNTGAGMNLPSPPDWYANANLLTVGSYAPPYYQYGDALIVYLSSVAPDYAQPIQTIGFSAGNMPAIDVANHVNKTYADARFAVNRVSLLDAACRDFAEDIAKFLASGVDGEPCWIDNYFATLGRYYPGTLNIRFPSPPAVHNTPLDWYTNSPDPSEWPGGDLHNDGITAGYYLSVAGPGKNLRLAPDANNYYFEWDSETDYLKFQNESLHPGRIPKAVTLIGPQDGAVVGADGAAFSCEVNKNAVAYQLLFGASPQRLNYIVSDTPSPPEKIITTFPFKTTYWTIRIRDEYGSAIYADPRRVEAENVTAQTIENVTTRIRYSCIQHAINDAKKGDEVVVSPGIYQYLENINLKGKALTVRSADPGDPAVVAATVISGGGGGSAVTFSGGEDANCVFAGFTVTAAHDGIYCSGASPMIVRCTIVGNQGAGVKLWNQSNPKIIGCHIADNAGAGVEMVARRAGRFTYYNCPDIRNCVIVGNQQQGILGGNPTVTNCTIVANRQQGISSFVPTVANCVIYYNGSDCGKVQIDTSYGTITYSNVEGSWPGQGNVSADPRFVDAAGGDYHLFAGSPCIDSGNNSAVPPEMTTDLDGKPRLINDPASADAGNGVPPIVDMGAYELVECFPSTYATYSDWVALGRPACWCAPYQCDGDADGNASSFPLHYRVYTGDLGLIVQNWKKDIDDPTLNPCADIDHKPEGALKHRVYMSDLNIVVTNWKRRDVDLPGSCPRPE
jgi:hypothetical protein